MKKVFGTKEMRTLLSTLSISLLLLFTSGISSCDDSGKVYVCASNGAKVYHRYKDCKGLSRCSKQIKTVSVEQAKKMGRRECKICY